LKVHLPFSNDPLVTLNNQHVENINLD